MLSCGAHVYGVYRWYQTGPVSIQTMVLIVIFGCLLWFVLIDYSPVFCQKIRQSINKSYLNLTSRTACIWFLYGRYFAPLTEELIFRGMLARISFLSRTIANRSSVFPLVSSVLFALIHFPGTLQQF